jgi:RNA polymerase sigma-70 factor (ECF subfamily)
MAKVGAEPPDEVLVVAAILGDLDAFDQLASRYRAAVVRTAQTIVGREDAEDVAQDALLLAFKALPSIEEPTKFAAWLSAITRHRAFRFSKRERPHQVGRIDLDEFLLERVQSLGHPLVAMPEGDDELKLALESVPADYALVLRLRFFDEMPLKRIAAFLGAPLSTVKWRIYRGKELLREQIEHLRQRGETWKPTEKLQN